MQSIIIGDEAGFALNGKANSHNERECAPKGNSPAFNFESTNSRAKLILWAALCGNGVILGLYFFDGNVNGLVYRMLDEFAFPQLAIHFTNHDQFWEGLFRSLWWAQDGAPAHRLIEVRDRLNEVFGKNRVIALQHNVEEPPCLPDLTPCDFSVGVSQEQSVYKSFREHRRSTPEDNRGIQRLLSILKCFDM